MDALNLLADGAIALSDLALEIEKEECERSLAVFVQQAWPHFDPAPYQHSFHIDGICEHLMAVTSGDIKKLLINIPPRHCKTGILLLWQVWTWTLRKLDEPGAFNHLRGPGVQFLCGAYNATKAQSDGVKARNLIRSEWFQKRWGNRVKISPYVDNREQFDTTAGGHRINVGIPESLGKGGIIRLLDDPHKTDEVESAVGLATVIRNYDETWNTRSNDPENGAEVIVMQRQAANDLSGHVLEQGDWDHFCLALEYEPERHCVTSIGWEDPRGLDDETGQRLHGAGDPDERNWCEELRARKGEPIWPIRFSSAWCREQEGKVGPFAYAGQYQQRPAPRGGGYVLAEWWRLWDKPVYPPVDLVCVSVDGAFTDKTANDPSAIQVWGRFNLPEIREHQFLLLWAWVGRCQTHELVERVGRACSGDWSGRVGEGLALKDGGTKADVLLVENKANGKPVAEEIVRLYGRRKWRTLLINPYGDKLGRLLSVQHLFSGLRSFDGETSPGQVWAPDTTWAQSVIDEVANYPKAGHDDQVDATTQALWWMRTAAGARTREEAEADYFEENRYRKPRRARYPCA